MTFLSFVDFKRASEQNCIYKLSKEDKILSSLINKNVVYMHFSKSLQGNK